MKNKTFTTILLGAVAAVSLAGCSPAAKQGAPSEAGTTAAQGAAQTETGANQGDEAPSALAFSYRIVRFSPGACGGRDCGRGKPDNPV